MRARARLIENEVVIVQDVVGPLLGLLGDGNLEADLHLHVQVLGEVANVLLFGGGGWGPMFWGRIYGTFLFCVRRWLSRCLGRSPMSCRRIYGIVFL